MFRCQAKSHFLTYIPCEWDQAPVILEKLKSISNYKGCIIGFDIAPTTNQPHLHILVQWTKKKDVKNANYFDVGDHHPNIQPGHWNRYEYVVKKEFAPALRDGELDETEIHGYKSDKKRKYEDDFNDIVATAHTKDDALDRLLALHAGRVSTSFSSVSAAVEHAMRSTPPERKVQYKRDTFDCVPDQAEEWTYNVIGGVSVLSSSTLRSAKDIGALQVRSARDRLRR